jgi:phenylacetate-CoA ligase
MLEDFVSKLPYPIKQVLKYIYGTIPFHFRYSKVFWDTYNFLQESQWWSKEKLEEYQMKQLEKLLRHSYENVPYYRRVFDERGLKLKDIQDFDDLKKLPYLTKEIIQNNLEDLVAQNYPKSKLQYSTTGGSTGIPMGFYSEKGISFAKEHAFIVTLWNRVGYKIGDKCIVLRGNVIQSANKGKFWEYDPINKNLILSSYHMTDKRLPEYIAKIREFQPDFIQAYPSAITILARFMKKHNIKSFPTVKTILCASENLYPCQIDLLESAFKCRAWDFYGHTEQAALAGQCEVSNYYHIQPEYGILELIRDDGNPVTSGDEFGEIIATGFNNFACPFIRYRTMDLAVPSHSKCECGRDYTLLKKIEGRLQELIVTKDKRLITLTALIFAQHFEAFSKIKEMQLVQEKEGELIVKIAKTSQYSANDEKEILSKMQRAVSNGLHISFSYVDHIPRTKNGKYKFLIQKLPIKFGE